MRSCALIVGFVVVCLIIALTGCLPPEIILHGELKGLVTDDLTFNTVPRAKVQLTSSNVISDTTRTGDDGSYQFTALTPSFYEVGVSKKAYKTAAKTIAVMEGEVSELDFEIEGIPSPAFSATYLDFGLEGTEAYLSIFNEGAGEFRYVISTSQDWITLDPVSGTISNDTAIVKIAVNREGLPGSKLMEEINILSYLRDDTQLDSISVLLNGVMGQGGMYYGVTTIGTQMWMAENLNTGKQIIGSLLPSDDGKFEKYCFDDDPNNCDIYGGLYTWPEAMDYHPEDVGEIGTTQGICPAGWHLPTYKEWETLINYAGGWEIAGGRLRDLSMNCWDTIVNWNTNEYGFSAIGGGWMFEGMYYLEHDADGEVTFWMTTIAPPYIQEPGENLRIGSYSIRCWDTQVAYWDDAVYLTPSVAYSVRCIKDP